MITTLAPVVEKREPRVVTMFTGQTVLRPLASFSGDIL